MNICSGVCYTLKMKFICIFFLLASFSSAHGFTKYQAYLDNVEDDDDPVTIFQTPGQNWKYCKKKLDPNTNKSSCDAVGWPDRDSQITVLGPGKKYKTKDPTTDETVMEEYVPVEFSYQRKGKDGRIYFKKDIGYIESFYLSKKRASAFYGAKASVKEDCPPEKGPFAKFKEVVKNLKNLTVSIENLSVAQEAELLSKVVGFCPLKPPTKLPKSFPSGNVYESLILPQLMSKNPPAIKNESGKQITTEEVVAIDALARTMYGEMARCYRKGLQYPMTVARIALNRAEAKDRHQEFIKPPQTDSKPDLAKVSISETQFSMWRKTKGDGSPNPPLHHALCPPIKLNEPFWNANEAPSMEANIWKNTMRIATEAVLHPKQFKKRTAEVDGFFYTSDMAHLKDNKKVKPFFRNMDRAYPTIEGKKVSSGNCVEVWKE